MSPAMERTTRTNHSTREPILPSHISLLYFYSPTLSYLGVILNTNLKKNAMEKQLIYSGISHFGARGEQRRSAGYHLSARKDYMFHFALCVCLPREWAGPGGRAGYERARARIQTCQSALLVHFRSRSRRPRPVRSADCRDEGPGLQPRRRNSPAGFRRREGQRFARAIHDARGPRGVTTRSGGGGGGGQWGRIPSRLYRSSEFVLERTVRNPGTTY